MQCPRLVHLVCQSLGILVIHPSQEDSDLLGNLCNIGRRKGWLSPLGHTSNISEGLRPPAIAWGKKISAFWNWRAVERKAVSPASTGGFLAATGFSFERNVSVTRPLIRRFFSQNIALIFQGQVNTEKKWMIHIWYFNKYIQYTVQYIKRHTYTVQYVYVIIHICMCKNSCSSKPGVYTGTTVK